MNAHTRISEKGQIVVPKPTRDRLGWQAGDDLEIFETSDAVTLRRRQHGGRLSVDEAVERLRALLARNERPVPVDQLGWSDDVVDDEG